MTSTATTAMRPCPSATVSVPLLEVVVVAHDEEADLERSVRGLHAGLAAAFSGRFRITVVDTASTDGTLMAALRLQRELLEVKALHLTEVGRPLALQTAWAESDAAVLAWADLNICLDPGVLPALVEALTTGRCDVAIATWPGAEPEAASGTLGRLVASWRIGLSVSPSRHGAQPSRAALAIRRDTAALWRPVSRGTTRRRPSKPVRVPRTAGLRIHEVPAGHRPGLSRRPSPA